MDLVTVRELYRNREEYLDKEVTIGGWVRSIRDSKTFGFIVVNDGSFFENLQVVYHDNMENFGEISKLNVGAAIIVKGTLVATPQAKQPFEIQATEVVVEGTSAPDYPLQKKRHSFEYLRSIAHLRPRTNTFQAVFRVRSLTAYAIHKFFQERGFVYVHTPLITGSDCEGAGEMFQVTTLDMNNVPKNADGTVDYSKDFFGKETNLTVSGQLNGETYAQAFRNIYTFGPTFRAENSNTTRHAAEFWMIEPEIAFADLEDDMILAENMLKYVIRYVMENAPEEMNFFNSFVDKGLIDRLNNVVNSDFARVTYTEAIEILEKHNDKFEYKVSWGADLQTEHDRYFLDRVATRIVEVDQGKLYSYPGNYSEFVKLKAERQDMALATERKRKSLLRTELEWLGRGARARSTKQKAHIDRIKAMQEIKDIQEEKRVVLDSIASRMGNKTIELENVSKSYDNRKLISDYSYIFLKNDRIGIIGPNGCGKTTLLKIINGIVRPDSGTIEIGQTIRIGYFSQENEYMDASMKVIDYVKEVGEYVTTSDGKITASQMLERFLFDGAMQWSKIEKLSGGEKRRLYLMRVLMSAPNVLILDEPTNDLDIQTLTILEDYLDHFDGIIITVSHDRYFLDRIVNRIFSFEGDGKVRQFEGGYSDYLIRKELEGLDTEMSLKGHAAATEEQSTKGESSSKDTWKQRKPKLKFTYKEQREFETIDDDIAKLEEKLETLDAQIAANATNSVKLRELMDKKEEAGNELDEKMERWVYLNDLNEKIQNADITKE